MSDTDFEGLDAFLTSSARPAGTLTCRELHGFLFTIACAPELVLPSEWLPMIFAEEDAGYASLDEAQGTLDRLMAMYNQINAAVFDGSYTLPPACAFRDDTMSNFGPDAPAGQWARGFLLGHQWLSESWDEYASDELDGLDGELAAIMMTLSFFSSRRLAEAFAAELTPRRTLRELAETMRQAAPTAIDSYVGLARAIRTAQQEVPPEAVAPAAGRNEPCPCGSGKKFKKCCGAVH